MAKKSAKSKGYRKQTGKKPYLSKRDIALLCVALVAVAVAAFFLFRYDDGALKVKDDKIVTDGDNWLIVNGSNTRGGARYYKLGEVGELAGFTREAKPTLTDVRLSEFVYTAEDEAAAVDSVTISTSHAAAKALSEYAVGNIAAIEGNEASEVRTETIGDWTVHCFNYSTSPAEAEEPAEEPADGAKEQPADEAKEEPADEAKEEPDSEPAEEPTEADGEAAPNYSRSLVAYVDASHDSCVLLRLQGGGETADACPTDEQLGAALEQALGAVKLEEAKK